MGSVGISTEPPMTIYLVVREVALEPTDLCLSLESKDMGSYPVEEPAIMTYDHGTPGKAEQTILKRPKGIYIEVVCRLIQ